MIHYTNISKDRVSIYNKWEDLTLHSAIDISAVELPAVEDTFDWYKHIDTVDRLLVLMSTMTQGQVDQIHPSQRVYLFTSHLLPLVQDLHTPAPQTYVPQMIERFKHNGIEYLMPTSLVIDEQTVVLQHGQQVKPFIEASNLMRQYAELKNEGIKVMPLFVASVVKEQHNEQWDEAKIVERSKAFKTLTMDVVWEVFFCISQHILKSQSVILQSMIEARKPKLQRIADKLALRLGRLRLREAELLERLKLLHRWRFGTF